MTCSSIKFGSARAWFMLQHGSYSLFEYDHVYTSFMWQVFLLLNPGLLSSVEMPPRRLHARPHIHRSLQNCSSQAHGLALSSENRVQSSRRASSPQSVHSIVHVRHANFTGTRSPSVYDLQIQGQQQSRLISVWQILANSPITSVSGTCDKSRRTQRGLQGSHFRPVFDWTRLDWTKYFSQVLSTSPFLTEQSVFSSGLDQSDCSESCQSPPQVFSSHS